MLLAFPISMFLLVFLDRALAQRMARAIPTLAPLMAAAALFLCEWLLGTQVSSMTAVIRSLPLWSLAGRTNGDGPSS